MSQDFKPSHSGLKSAFHVACGIGVIAVLFSLLGLGQHLLATFIIALAFIAAIYGFGFIMATIEVTHELLTDKEFRERKEEHLC